MGTGMTKQFFEVFPKIHTDRQLRELFEDTRVYSLAANKERSRFAVRFESDHLIHKKDVLAMRELLAGQVFKGNGVEVFLEENFRLSALYDTEKLLQEYRDSIEWELWRLSPVQGSLFRDAVFSYPEKDTLSMSLEDSVFSRNSGEQLRRYIEQVLTRRCGLKAQVLLTFQKEGISRKQRLEEERTREAERSRRRQEEAGAVLDAMAANGNGQIFSENDGKEAALAQDGQASFYGGNSSSASGSGQRASEVSGSGSKAAEGTSLRSVGRKDKNTDKAYRSLKRSDHPDVIIGREIQTESIPISEILGEQGEVTVRGQITGFSTRDIRNDKTIVKFMITDFTDTISVKVFIPTEFTAQVSEKLKDGNFVKVQGITKYDTFDKEVTIQSPQGIMSIPDFRSSRKDTAPVKRVELHLHTKMSDMDGISECTDLVKRAYKWGMPAVAITDHGNIQAFPAANHLREDLFKGENNRRKEAGLPKLDTQDFFKIIYGVEAYIVDDMTRCVTFREDGFKPETALSGPDYVVFDLETTGFSCENDRIIEFGAVKIRDGKITDRFSCFVNPERPIPFRIQKLTGISDDMVIGAETIEAVFPKFMEFANGCVLVGHNVRFDISFIRENAKRLGAEAPYTTIDTVDMARTLYPGHRSYNLEAVSKLLNVSLQDHHRAVNDAECTAEIFQKLCAAAEKEPGENTLGKLNALAEDHPEIIRTYRKYHCILLAANDVGRVNMYTMISASNLVYFHGKPIIPKSMLAEKREGIIVGSACCAGELYQAILKQYSQDAILQIADFYDYLEIQPRENNKFMIENTRSDYEQIREMEDILNINRRIVELGEQLNKPVVATGDVHFMDPEDGIYREIIQDSIGMGDKEDPAQLYFRTTDEMLEEFAYLGKEKCYEVVVTNTQKIADMIEVLSPVRPDKCPPVIENSDENLRKICYDKAHSMYGDPLPPIVEERLERELNSIIKNGYSVMYIIAQKLVWKSVEDGYLVGSRGSVGSSFVATMSGITEVNPLSPHYYCLNCHFSDFDSPEVMKYQGRCGIDMPARICPRCGAQLKKDGFDIPFETFLGFKGDKEPDIDLNFSGEYQSKAHAYTKVIFGHEQTFKAGTIGTVADKTAYGFVKGFFERRETEKRAAEILRLSTGCVGIKRSTGQHPGGIVVLPLGEDINTFTPVQHPANDMTTDIVTTHFDYHSIDHNLLKLDILGHDDPTMIRMLQDMTGLDPLEIPLDDPKVMSLFQGTEALGITPEDIDGVQTGTLGVPEFGTKFVIGMLEDTRPSSMSELVRISGLSHGTDVWLGNAQTLIQEGKATLSTAICTRDDIMGYLIQKGVEKSLAFKTMESVRKGKGLKPEMVEAMQEADVPEWYMDSCRKIAYMFPRAHAAAYVMMALRIAYCKVYYPLAYYAAYFSIRASAFSYELMCQGKEYLLNIMNDYKARKDTLSKKEQDQLDDMHIVLEMYARGFEFLPMDLFASGSRLFKIVDGKLLPSFISLDGMGEKAADSLAEAAKDGPFVSRDDLRNRAHVSQTIVDKLGELGILGDLPDSNQISIFDWMK